MVAARQLDSVLSSLSRRVTGSPQPSTGGRSAVFLGAITSLSFFLSACPSTSPTPTSIDHITVSGDPTSGEFSLRVIGRGFSPTTIRFDLSSGVGTAKADLRLEIFDPTDVVHVEVPKEQISVLSQGELDARILDNPLKPGIYGLRLYPSQGSQVIATVLPTMGFSVTSPGPKPQMDAATTSAPDADDTSTTPPDTDAGVGDEDAVSDDTGVVTKDDAATPDAAASLDGAVDAGGGNGDVGLTPDSGVGPFIGAYRFRQRVNAVNATQLPSPAGNTIAVTIPLATMARLGQAKPDGSDVALYLGTSLLDSQFDDIANLASDQVMLIAKLPVDVAPGPIPDATPLYLYFGDPATTVTRLDTVYLFAERFNADVPTVAMNPTLQQWSVNGWARCDRNNLPNPPAAAGLGGAYCYSGAGTTADKRSISTPVIPGVVTPLQANLTYEFGAAVGGRMVQADLLYFAYGDSHVVTNTTVPEPAAYLTNPPNVTGFTFTDNNNTTRTVSGWRFPILTPSPLTRARARFIPAPTPPTLHFRFLALTGLADDGTFVAISDLTVRQTLSPDWSVTLGPLEAR